MQPRRVHGLSAATALLGLLSGCYNYLPLTTAAPNPGTRVTADLTDSGTSILAPYLGPGVGSVDGQLVRLTDQELVLAVVATRNRSGIEHYWNGEAVTLPRGDVAGLRERRLATARTIVVVTGGVGGAIALLGAFGVINAGGTSTSTPPPPQ